MSIKISKKLTLGQFITTVVLVVVLIISAIFVVISQTNSNVQRSTEEHAVKDMEERAEWFAQSICFALDNGIADLDKVLSAESFTYKVVFVTDSAGNIVARSALARYTIPEDNIFLHFSGCEYLDGVSEAQARALVRAGQAGYCAVMDGQKETLVFRELGRENLRLFYLLHQAEVEKLYDESTQYLKTVRLLGIAYMSVTLGLVFLMINYIVTAIRSSEIKLYLSDLRTQNAQKQARTYLDITRVLSQSYEKVYHVNISNGQYLEYVPTEGEKEPAVRNKGENFWGAPYEALVMNSLEEDRDSLRRFLDRKTVEGIPTGDSKRLRFRMKTDGEPVYYYIKGCLTEAEGQRYLVLGIKNVDALVSYDLNQIAERDAALRRMEIYRSALMDNMLACVEFSVSDGLIYEGPLVVGEGNELRQVEIPGMSAPFRFEELVKLWIRDYCNTENAEFFHKNSRAVLRQEFENGYRFVEMNYKAKWLDGSVREIRQNFYMNEREQDGAIVALCVLYDLTEKISREREIETLTAELDQSRIKISTGQMQPHFLYNVLGSIREIILEDPQYASDLICDFTTHLRACIRSMSNDDLIPFEKEVENIKAYVNIERMRFGNRMQVEFDIQTDDFSVVPLSIQPLVENAIRHGLYPKKDGMGYVKISAYNQNGYKVIVVKDNGVGFDYEKVTKEILEHQRDSAGIRNLTLRLEKVMNARVYFDSKIGIGTTVTVLIPEKKEEEQ